MQVLSDLQLNENNFIGNQYTISMLANNNF